MLGVYAFSARWNRQAAPGGGTRGVRGFSSGPEAGAERVAGPPQSGGETARPNRAPDRRHRTYGRLDADIDVLIVDDHPGVRSAIEALVAGTPGLRVAGSVSGGAAAIEAVARLRPTVVVMDLAMPAVNGVEATRRICTSEAAPVVVAFSGSRERWREARAAGAAHTLLKDEDPATLLETIRVAGRG